MKKIALITPSLAKGGLEKVVVEAAVELEKVYDVTLIVMDSFRVDYPYDGKVVELNIGLENRNLLSRFINLFNGMLRLRKIKKSERFDLVIGHGELASLPNILSGVTKNIAVVHENRFAAIKDFQGKLVNKVIRYFYSFPSVCKIVTVSEGIRESFIDILDLNPEKIVSIYNPYDIEDIQKRSLFDFKDYEALFDAPVITITGRLTMQKGQWYLLRIFKALKKRMPEYKLIILGIGEMKDVLIELSNDLGLKTFDADAQRSFDTSYDVYFLGFQSNPFYFVKHSKLFVMTSLWEGFGNTIVEAMACGTPVISSDCPSGPGEIIAPQLKQQGLTATEPEEDYGILMPPFENRFAEADEPLSEKEKLWVDTMQALLDDEERLKRLSLRGLQRADDFRTEKIMAQWRDLIEDVLKA